jgi:serine/threonine protein kinase
LLYELLTGETPYAGSGFEVLLAHLGRPAPRPSDKIAELPEAIDRLTLALMAKKPGERVSSADTLVDMIDDTLDVLEDQLPEPPKAPRSKRKTAATRKDKPSQIPIPKSALEPLPLDPDPPRPAEAHKARWMAIGAALAFALSIGGLLVARVIAGPDVSASPSEDRDTPTVRREIFRDDGSLRLRAWVPDPLTTGQRRIWIELRNKLGALIVTNELVVIVEDPSGNAIGGIARPRSSNPEQFAFLADFKTPGTYQIRIFPPETAAKSSTTFTIPVDVK